jgi:hypothetical protein
MDPEELAKLEGTSIHWVRRHGRALAVVIMDKLKPKDGFT